VSDALNDKGDCAGVGDEGLVGWLRLKRDLKFLELLSVEFAQPPVQLTKNLEEYDAWSLGDHPLPNDQQVASAIPLVSFSWEIDYSG
jgi:hypothetical protein